MHAYFHIGRPKTGSTSIQDFLLANTRTLGMQNVLHDRLDMQYSSQWELPIAALTAGGFPLNDPHVSVLLQLTEMDRQKAYSERMLAKFESSLARKSSGKDTFVASSEHAIAYLPTSTYVAEFDKLLKRYFDSITYVVYLRDQVSLCASAYSEQIKRGHTTKQIDFVRRAVQRGWFDHERVLRPWIDTVGPERIKVRLMERDALVSGDLIDDFCSVIGVDPAGMERPAVENPALSRDATEVMRVVNGFLPVLLDDGRHNPLRKGVQDRLLEHYADAPKLRLSSHQAEYLMDASELSNETIRKMFYPDRENLFAPRPLPSDKNAWVDGEAALQMAVSLLIAARQGQLPPLRRSELMRAQSNDPHTACPSGEMPQQIPWSARVGALSRTALRRMNIS